MAGSIGMQKAVAAAANDPTKPTSAAERGCHTDGGPGCLEDGTALGREIKHRPGLIGQHYRRGSPPEQRSDRSPGRCIKCTRRRRLQSRFL